MSAVPTDEIYEKYLQKAITEINELGDEIAEAAGGAAVPVARLRPPARRRLPAQALARRRRRSRRASPSTGAPGRRSSSRSSGCASTRWPSTGRTASSSPAAPPTSEARGWLTRELHIVQPKLVVVMGEDALAFLNDLEFPLSQPARARRSGELQQFTPTIEALVVPDIDTSLDEQPAKTAFWNAFKVLGSWWAELPPY